MSNRYEIRDQIGKGGLGAVYKAFDTQLQREVAMKRVLSPEQASEEEVRDAADNLIGEAQTLSSLNHPNIITVFDVGQDENGGFVVMELLKGETLDETIERGVLTQEDFTEVVYQTMEALIAAQASDVIHRDIKPTNIMVIWQASGKFQLKILDFGLAKFSKTPSVQTMDQEDSVLGSIFFMAPEQFERGELDARSDLYQMGCVYYNALTGQYPFNGDTAPQVMNAHLQHKVIPLDQIRPDLPPAICQWVMWLINRDMEHRPADARDALKRWPRNPEPADEVPVAKALPVEETPEVASDSVKIVTADSQASAPPSLIVKSDTSSTSTGARTGRLQTGPATGPATGARTGRLQTGPAPAGGGRHGRATGTITGSIGGGRPNVRKAPPKPSSHKGKWIVLGAIVAVIVVIFAVGAYRGSVEEEQRNRIVSLASDEGPEPTLEDVDLAIDLIADPATTPSLRSDAMEALGRAEGPAVNERIHARLQEAEDTALQIRLSDVLSGKGFEEAVPTILAAFRSAGSDKEKVQLLSSVRAIAGMDQVGQILDSLQGSHSLAVRSVFEETVLAVLRKSDDTDEVVGDILTRVSTTAGPERKSLFRILGAIGGERVETRLASIYQNTDDPEYQRDAMVAYLNWKDRSAMPEVESIIESTSDELLEDAAVKAYVRMASLPGPLTPEERIEGWNKAWQWNDNASAARRLVAATIEYPSQPVVQMLQEWGTHPRFGNLAKQTIPTLRKSMSNLPELAPGDELEGNRARVQGNSRAAINSFLGSLTSWTSPDTWFGWSFRLAEPGEYAIEIDQASLREDSSEFRVHLAGKTFEEESRQTPDLEEFTTVRLPGTISLEKGRIYTLILEAGERIQPRMMDIRAVRLVRP